MAERIGGFLPQPGGNDLRYLAHQADVALQCFIAEAQHQGLFQRLEGLAILDSVSRN